MRYLAPLAVAAVMAASFPARAGVEDTMRGAIDSEWSGNHEAQDRDWQQFNDQRNVPRPRARHFDPIPGKPCDKCKTFRKPRD
jgi:hypothetical protein